MTVFFAYSGSLISFLATKEITYPFKDIIGMYKSKKYSFLVRKRGSPEYVAIEVNIPILPIFIVCPKRTATKF